MERNIHILSRRQTSLEKQADQEREAKIHIIDKTVKAIDTNVNVLNEKASTLENAESLRRSEEEKFNKLKATSPAIDARLDMDNKRNIYVVTQFLNAVPINLTYSLIHSKNDIILMTENTSTAKIFPTKDNKPIVIKDDFNFPEHIPKEELSKLKIDIDYESIYFLESQNTKLKKHLTKTFIIDPVKNIIYAEEK